MASMLPNSWIRQSCEESYFRWFFVECDRSNIKSITKNAQPNGSTATDGNCTVISNNNNHHNNNNKININNTTKLENSLTNFSNYTPKTNKTSNNIKSLKSSPSSSSNHCQSNNNIPDSLHIYYQNVRGIRTKSKNFYLQTLATNCDVITLTETWLNNSHKSEEYFGNDFIVYRRDRSHLNSSASIGGGVLLAISSKIHSEQLNLDGFDHLEFICTKLTFKKTKFIIYCLYIPPNATIDTFHDHIDAIKKN